MDFNRSKEPSYTHTSRNSGDSGKGGVHNDVKSIWNQFIKDGPMFDFQKFEHALADITSSNDAEYMDKVREVFMDELSKVKKLARKYSDKILDKVGTKNVTDTQVLEYVTKQGEKNKLPSYMVEAITREVAQTLSERPSRTPYFRFQPYKNTSIGSSLGYIGQDKYDHFSKQNHPSIKHMEETKLRDATHHSNVITQSLHYTDCDVEAITGGFNAEKNDKYLHIHPVVAALFLPKIKLLEEVMLYSSIANVVLARSKNEPISTRPDYELFYNMVHDPNQFVCHPKDALNDLAMRSDIQLALWQAVLSLRSGRYYSPAGMFLLEKLNTCKYYKYDAPDIGYPGNEADITKRLLMTFSLRPIKVRTLPALPSGGLSLNTPFVNYEMQNGNIDTLPLANIRLSLYNENTPVPKIEHVLRNNEFFFDYASKQIIPKITQIITTNKLLIVNIHRRQLVVPLTRFNGPYTFRELPTTPKDYFTLNTKPVAVPKGMTLNNENYTLRSVVVTKITNYVDSVTKTPRVLPQGSEAVIFPMLQETELDLPNHQCLIYDPAGVGARLDDLRSTVVSDAPITMYSYNDPRLSEQDLMNRISTQGVVVVYTKNGPDE